MEERKYQYELIEQSCKQVKNCCGAFIFNQLGSILVIACNKEIIVNQFKDGVIGCEVQRLVNHTDIVRFLAFMCDDCLIIIWEFLDQIWIAKTLLKGHKSKISCFAINSSEDLLISGSQGRDETIKFWNKNGQNWSHKEIISSISTKENGIKAISLNTINNIAIACTVEQILVIKMIEKWQIIQEISAKSDRLCFFGTDQFVVQPNNSESIDVYKYNQKEKQFKMVQQIKIQRQRDYSYQFPCQFIQQLMIVAVKAGYQLCIIKIAKDQSCQLLQSIDFGNDSVYGRFTEDGQYLVTWDGRSQQIQVRKQNQS